MCPLLNLWRKHGWLDTGGSSGVEAVGKEKDLGLQSALLPTHLLSGQEFHRLPNDVLGSSLLLMSS